MRANAAYLDAAQDANAALQMERGGNHPNSEIESKYVRKFATTNFSDA